MYFFHGFDGLLYRNVLGSMVAPFCGSETGFRDRNGKEYVILIPKFWKFRVALKLNTRLHAQ